MNYTIPSYVEQRIREIPPTELYIVDSSTPVVAFGNPQNSRVATIGINPSKQEFLDRSGQELTGDKRRLETLNSLGLTNIENINEIQVRRIWEACKNYFHGNPYKWFDTLEKILKHFRVSYYSDTACHLDLVQWATDPVWGQIENTKIQDKLIENDKFFLRKQIENENFEILLLNGATVIKQFKKTFTCKLEEHTKLADAQFSSRIYRGDLLNNKVQVFGWSINPQSSYKGEVPDTFIEQIAQTVSSL